MAPGNDPQIISNWQSLYLGDRGRKRGGRQVLLVVIPSLAMIMYVGFVFFLFYSDNQRLLFSPETYSLPARFALIAFFMFIPFLIVLAIIQFLFVSARKFISDLYNPSDLNGTMRQIRRRLFGLLSRNIVLVNNSKLTSSDHWSTWLGGPAYLVIFDGFAAYLEKGNRFSRVVGAGFPIPYLDARETIKAIVDLRPQIRETQVNGWTKDGIRIKLKVRVEFQIFSDPAGTLSGKNLLYPFYPLAVQKAVEYTALRFREGEFQDADWYEGAVGKVTGFMSHHISSCHLDELFLDDKGDNQVLSEKFTKKLFTGLKANLLRDVGVDLTGIQIIDIEIPKDVHRQWLDIREAEKSKWIAGVLGEAQAYGIRVNEAARAKSQRDLIVAIAKSLEPVRPGKFPEPILLSLSSLIDQSLADPFIRGYLGHETLQAIEKLRGLI